MKGPHRIVCLTEETTETLYLLGEQDRIVGISAFTVRPADAKRHKPIVSQYVRADIEAIVALRPDLVLAFSDLQAGICADLIAKGIDVYCFNQRTIDEILEMIHTVARLVGCADKGDSLVSTLRGGLHAAAQGGADLPVRPRVFFEEWPEPIITGIGWVSELIELVGGVDCFADLRTRRMAKDRIVTADEVIAREPHLYLASWCGRRFHQETALNRPGFRDAAFTKQDRIREIPSSIILQPGPACLTDGLAALQAAVTETAMILALDT